MPAQVVEIGEALCGFGTADFGERSNSSRAITTKDYAYLLRLYGESFGSLFRQEFVDHMPQVCGAAKALNHREHVWQHGQAGTQISGLIVAARHDYLPSVQQQSACPRARLAPAQSLDPQPAVCACVCTYMRPYAGDP